jgi:c-di-GMP-binding flagellar brake protein YcgR
MLPPPSNEYRLQRREGKRIFIDFDGQWISLSDSASKITVTKFRLSEMMTFRND